MDNEDDLSEGQLLVHEYRTLKAEQLSRIGTRDNLIYVTLASLAAVGAGTLQANAVELMFLVGPVCLVLGWTYLINDQKVSAIGHYLRTVVTPRLEDIVGSPGTLFTWELQHRSDPRRRTWKIGQLLVDLLTFCCPAIVAITIYFHIARPAPWAVVAAIVELIAIVTLAVAIFSNADLGRGEKTENSRASAYGVANSP